MNKDHETRQKWLRSTLYMREDQFDRRPSQLLEEYFDIKLSLKDKLLVEKMVRFGQLSRKEEVTFDD